MGNSRRVLVSEAQKWASRAHSVHLHDSIDGSVGSPQTRALMKGHNSSIILASEYVGGTSLSLYWSVLGGCFT